MRIKAFGYIYHRDTIRFKTICLLAPLAIKVNMLVGNGVMCVAMTQLIFERAAAILYHMHYFLFRKKFKHSENAAQGDFSVDAPCTRLTKYRETAEHEEGKVTDPMHLSTQSLNL